MKKAIATLAAAFTLSLLAVAVPAQNPPGPQPSHHFFRLHFAVEELDAAGQITNTRSYEETISTDNGREQEIKTGSRVPIATGSYGSSANPSVNQTQFQYVDLGVDLGVLSPKEQGSMLSFRLKAEVSSVVRQTAIAGVNEPVIRQNAWDSTVDVPIGKHTVVYSSDDLDSKGQMRIAVTAIPIE
jgi:Bacterial type II and III secretion system protein